MANEKMNNAALIEAVRRYDVLYNRQNPKYRDNFHRQSLWNLIASEVPFFKDGKAANARWKQLRQAYTRFRKKVIEKPKTSDYLDRPADDCASSSDDYNNERWANMRWLEPYLEDADENSLYSSDINPDFDEYNVTKFSNASNNCKLETGSSQYFDEEQQSPYFNNDYLSKLKTNNFKRKRICDIDFGSENNDKPTETNNDGFDENFNQKLFEAMAAQLTQTVQETQSTSQNISSHSSSLAQPSVEGEEEAYGKYITEKMKKLTPQQRFQARMKIENLFYELEYGQIE